MKKFTLILVFAILANVFLTSNLFGQITQRGTATTATGTTTSITVNKPTGVVQNDVMIAIIAKQGNTADATAPAGWNLIAGTNLAGGTDRNGTVFYRVAGASEPADYAFTLGTGTNHVAATILAFYNVDVSGANPFDVAPATELNLGGSGATTATALSATTANANAAIIMCTMAAGSNPAWSGWTTTSPGALTEIADVQEGDGTDGASAGAAWAIKATAGATGNGTASLAPGERNGAILLALKGIAAPVPPAVTWVQPSLPWGTLLINNNSNPYQVERNGDINWPGGNGTFNFVYSVSPNSGFTVASGALVTNNTTGTTTTPVQLNFTTAGIYTITCTVTENGGGSTVVSQTRTIEVLATTPTTPTLWATSSSGSIVSSFVVNQGTYISGPATVFTPTFTGTNGGSSTAALGVYSTNLGNPATRFYYYLPNNGSGSNTQGTVTIYGANSSGTIAEVGTIDMNGASATNLGFVRLGMRADGVGFILAGDGSSAVYLAKFVTNGINPATVTMEDADGVTLVGGTASVFQNGDLAVAGNGTIWALANDGSGATHIYKGTPNGNSTTFTKVFDLLDHLGAPFTGSVNGIAFDNFGSLYISTAAGLYYLNKQTVNGSGGTVACSLVWSVTGLQDLGSDAFPQNIILPLNLTAFTAALVDGKSVLNWKTASEVNTARFEIERSYDGTNFVKAGEKMAAGNSTSDISYQYSELYNTNYQIIYYRLKAVDIDGKSSYSKVVALRLSGDPVKDLTVFPNPFTTDLKLQISSLTETTGTVRISNANGQVVYNRNIILQKGENIVVLNSGLETLKSGMHIMEVITAERKVTQKIIKH